ncbi:MAG: 3-deoxy-D-manno-octulosonic acid transferase [Alphaproteobacteria bacterium]|nr:3-deoxy-D-manno-octulosonic acid transferase [Alphaproteobacteria bacterium]
MSETGTTAPPPIARSAEPDRSLPLLSLYRGFTTVGLPLIQLLLRRRVARGKEDPTRIEERRGVASLQRPEGPLVWIHAASIGEAQSVLVLIERLTRERPTLNVLMTTGTVTSASLMAERLPPRALHQFVPVDRPAWVRRFLAYWRPDMAIWVESELWPNLLLETTARDAPMVLLNARISAQSHTGWQRAPGLARRLLSSFSLVLAQDETIAARLASLGATNVSVSGNLKTAAAPLPATASELVALQDAIGSRPVWLAASTHDSEEAIAGQAHADIAKNVPDLLTIIAPRHPQRAAEIATGLTRDGHTVARRSLSEPITEQVDIYLADGTGELGLFYRIAPIAFIGGSLIPHGGQNMLEPAVLKCAILHGPHVTNFQAIADELAQAGASRQVDGADTLATTVAALLIEPDGATAMADAAAATATVHDDVLDRVMATLAPLLDSIAPVGP